MRIEKGSLHNRCLAQAGIDRRTLKVAEWAKGGGFWQPIAWELPADDVRLARLNEIVASRQARQGSLAAAKAKRQERDILRLETEIKRQFPACPCARQIAARAAEIGSNRVGRSGELSLSEKAKMAVVAYARHKETLYDSLWAEWRTEKEATGEEPDWHPRDEISLRILDSWRNP